MKREHILQSSMEIIQQYGLEHLTMDEVARQCGISKKTIYQFFLNKNSLLEELASAYTGRELSRFLEGFPSQEPSEKRIMYSFNFLLELSGLIPYANLYYLKKHHPPCYILFEHLQEEIFRALEREIRNGQAEGVVYNDVEASLLCSLVKTQLQSFQKEYPRLQGREKLIGWQQQIRLAFRRSVLRA